MMTACEKCETWFVPNNEKQRLCNAAPCRAIAKAARNQAIRERRRAARQRAWDALTLAAAGSGYDSGGVSSPR